MKILLAEDDINISTIAKLALTQLGGHEVDHASDGEKALQMALDGNYDVILLDEMMPKMNGLMVCKEFKQRTTKDTPVIFLSAKSQENDISEFMSMGLGYIPKPFDPTQLNQAIIDILRGQRKGKSVA